MDHFLCPQEIIFVLVKALPIMNYSFSSLPSSRTSQCPAFSAAPAPCLLLPAETEPSSDCVLELVQTKGHPWTPRSPVPRAGLPCSWARQEEHGLEKSE